MNRADDEVMRRPIRARGIRNRMTRELFEEEAVREREERLREVFEENDVDMPTGKTLRNFKWPLQWLLELTKWFLNVELISYYINGLEYHLWTTYDMVLLRIPIGLTAYEWMY